LCSQPVDASALVENLKLQYPHHRLHLCSALPELGYSAQLTDFWQACLQKLPLSGAMLLLHRAGLTTP
jgi:hypothetical protein